MITKSLLQKISECGHLKLTIVTSPIFRAPNANWHEQWDAKVKK